MANMDNNGSTSSSMTSTSHTMTAFPQTTTNLSFPTLKNSKVPLAMNDFLRILAPEKRYLPITVTTCDLGLQFSKNVLELFAGKLGDEQLQRQKEARKKRKRGERDTTEGPTLKIRKLHTDGFEVGQVWEQATRVINALREDVRLACKDLSIDVKNGITYGAKDGQMEDSDDSGSGQESVDESRSVDGSEEGVYAEADDEVNYTGGVDAVEYKDLDGLDDYQEEDDEIFDQEEENYEIGEPEGIFVEDPHGLNDGFFSIDDFNRQTEFLERQDAAADPYTGEASDEEDIDWDADPTAIAITPVSSSKRVVAMDIEDDDDEDMDDEEEDGPTFGNMDLDAPEGDSDNEADEDGEDDDDDENTNGIFYRDFFEPPPRKASKGERQANYLARQARKPKVVDKEDEIADLERAKAAVSRDLFDDFSDMENSEDALSDVDPADPKSRRSAHERRQAKVKEEIRRLEAASVAKRDWALSGEARAGERPLDSLIETDLDFEHVGKTVPEVTAEVNEDIESLIKRRILAQEFDEVIKRRPDSLGTSSTRRGAYELDDGKPKQSLAEMYEEEHVKLNNPDTYVSKADEKLQKEEKEIEGLWKDVSAKLDALSSWHYKPKPAAPSLTIVGDVATISMEDAQPTTAAGVGGGESMLAPQEIYTAGKDKDAIEKGEIMPKSGAPIARQEMTREEKLRRRRREKERIKKRGGDEQNQRPQSKKVQQKNNTIDDLKKGGVKVIDKKGIVRDVNGNKVQVVASSSSAGGFKL
ncbi:U3 small nucleolar ribonucleoprotein complex, subunit Mpp10 [Bisporella sp. PMI_857]|nr:U3 small nucleolar ribonucleoprotein complex, subunit Mpp10 [Bisporella sp. PMI_857]